MKDPVRDVDSRSTLESNRIASQSSAGVLASRSIKTYRIEKFPKEFRKDYFRTIDVRFLIIFLITFATELSILLYLEHRVPPAVDAVTISNIQQKYVELLLEKSGEPATPSSFQEITGTDSYVEPIDYQTLTGLSQWMDVFADKALDSFEEAPSFTPVEPAPVERRIEETVVPTKEQVETVRETRTVQRARSRTELEEEVSNIGLLGMLSGKQAAVDKEYIDDLLEYSELNADHFASVLSKLNSIQVPRHNTAGYIISQRKQAYEVGNLRRGRVDARDAIAAAAEDITPIAEAKTTSVAREVKYEDVPSNALEKLRPQPGSGVVREAKDVMRVVQSHKRALQDCYKQALKEDPTVRGRIIIRFTVDPLGEVIDASVVSSSLNNRQMEECLTYRIGRWRDFGYSDPAKGNVTYKQVFNFGK